MITLHHLTFSRSTRIIWLLEELELPYNLVTHERGPDMRAPASLKAVHPLGKAPVIEDDGLILAESGAIIEHIVSTHGGGRLAPAPGTAEHAKWREWLHYAEGSVMMPVLITLFGNRTGLTEGMRAFITPESDAHLGFVARAVTGSGYLLDGFSSADIQMSYVVQVAQMAGLLEPRPALSDYLARLEARPAFAKSIAIGGPVALPSR